VDRVTEMAKRVGGGFSVLIEMNTRCCIVI